MSTCNRCDLSSYIEIISSQCVPDVPSSDVIGIVRDLIVVIVSLQLAQLVQSGSV